MKTKLEIKVKQKLANGTKTENVIVLPVGSTCEFVEPSMLCHVSHEGIVYKVRASSAFKAPSIRQLEKWSNDGVCKSIGGNTTEPDGWSHDGSPSWLLAMGMI